VQSNSLIAVGSKSNCSCNGRLTLRSRFLIFRLEEENVGVDRIDRIPGRTVILGVRRRRGVSSVRYDIGIYRHHSWMGGLHTITAGVLCSGYDCAATVAPLLCNISATLIRRTKVTHCQGD